MRRALSPKSCRRPNPCASSSQRRLLSSVTNFISPLDRLSTDEFRRRAFIPELPLLVTSCHNPDADPPIASRIGAIRIWFNILSHGRQALNFSYLEQFQDITLPYELVSFPEYEGDNFERLDSPPYPPSNEPVFQRFHAPLQLFLTAARLPQRPQLYIAQAHLRDLPKQLQDDLLTPQVVLEAGNGDVYDANIWMGIPPTYTPLHRDPNPNLLVQIASKKVIRLYKPDVGSVIFRNMQKSMGRDGSATIRGDEMMQGPERKILEDAVWNCPHDLDGYEAVVQPGDALFIPKGWWHSIKSIGNDINASVNTLLNNDDVFSLTNVGQLVVSMTKWQYITKVVKYSTNG